MLCRLVTGLGAGGCPVISRAVLSDVFKEKRSLTQALAVFSMASQVSPAFAPMIGGVIALYLSWHYNFAALFLITLQGTIKMAGAGLTLWLIALVRPTELMVLMKVILALTGASLLLGLLVALPCMRETLAADKA